MLGLKPLRSSFYDVLLLVKSLGILSLCINIGQTVFGQGLQNNEKPIPLQRALGIIFRKSAYTNSLEKGWETGESQTTPPILRMRMMMTTRKTITRKSTTYRQLQRPYIFFIGAIICIQRVLFSYIKPSRTFDTGTNLFFKGLTFVEILLTWSI